MCILVNKVSGRKRGFAFVRFRFRSEAKRGIDLSRVVPREVDVSLRSLLVLVLSILQKSFCGALLKRKIVNPLSNPFCNNRIFRH